jgi:histidyl-tRNA synthetase
VGFAIGDMTFALLLEERGLAPVIVSAPDIYCVLGGEAERRAAFADIHALRSGGYRVEYPLRDVAFGKQLKAAVDSGAKIALIYGGDELARGVVKMRDLGEKAEREFPAGEVEANVRGFFGSG